MTSGAEVRGPSPRPCASCPYRCDVPSGIWHAEEYQRLLAYDLPTGEQPHQLFLCHQTDADDEGSRLCAGWVGCHGDELLALRLATLRAELSAEAAQAVISYESPVPLFADAAAAAAHGIAEISDPSPRALALIDKITVRRGLGD